VKRLVVILLAVLLGFFLGSTWNHYFRPEPGPGNNPVPGLRTPERSAPARGQAASTGFSSVVDGSRPSVVHLVASGGPLALRLPPVRDHAESLRPDAERELGENTGSGVIVSPDGIIVTNYHVVGRAAGVRALLQDRREFQGTVIGVDPRTDLAVVKIDGENLPFAPWGDSDALRVGEYVLAMGSPFGLHSTVTMGIVSATGRAGIGITEYEDFIQTDAAINPGNSGGPLLNVAGELVGINTAIVSEHGGYQGIGFAVPSNLVRNVVEQLVKTGVVRRGWLGISVQDVDAALALNLGVGEVRGALVADIDPDGPASGAGLMPGDVIVSFGGSDIIGTADFRNKVAASVPGQAAEATVIREGRVVRLRLLVGEKAPDPGLSGRNPAGGDMQDVSGSRGEGMELKDLSPGVAKQLDLPPSVRGVLVSRVVAGRGAWRAGLRRGDVILELNRKPVGSVEEYERVREGAGSSLLFYIRRGGQSFFILLDVAVPDA